MYCCLNLDVFGFFKGFVEGWNFINWYLCVVIRLVGFQCCIKICNWIFCYQFGDNGKFEDFIDVLVQFVGLFWCGMFFFWSNVSMLWVVILIIDCLLSIGQMFFFSVDLICFVQDFDYFLILVVNQFFVIFLNFVVMLSVLMVFFLWVCFIGLILLVIRDLFFVVCLCVFLSVISG